MALDVVNFGVFSGIVPSSGPEIVRAIDIFCDFKECKWRGAAVNG